VYFFELYVSKLTPHLHGSGSRMISHPKPKRIVLFVVGIVASLFVAMKSASKSATPKKAAPSSTASAAPKKVDTAAAVSNVSKEIEPEVNYTFLVFQASGFII
jgi:hypothetical protein